MSLHLRTARGPGAAARPAWTRPVAPSVSGVVVLALAVAAAFGVGPALRAWGLTPVSPRQAVAAVSEAFAVRPPGWPPRAAEASAPLGTPSPGTPSATPPSTAYRFAMTQADGSTPVAWDPCRPVHVVVDDAAAPPGSAGLVEQALTAISAATGLVMVVDGTTTEQPSADRAAYQPDRYGRAWAPVLIGWTTPAVDPRLAGDTAGMGGSTAYSTGGGPLVYVSGQASLDGPQLGAWIAAGDRQQALDVIEHELGHVVGLGHVDDPRQLMYPDLQASNHGGLAAGDLAGLAALGHGTCAAGV